MASFVLINTLYLSLVPTRAPSNVSFTDVRRTQITVKWNPLPWKYRNGRLLGYRVHIYDLLTSLNVTTTRITLTGLLPGTYYFFTLSAFTSKGEGPFAYGYFRTGTVTTNFKIVFKLSVS